MKNTKKSNKLVYLLALWPLVSAGLFMLSLTIDVEVWYIIRPIYELSVVGILLILFGIFSTGFCGYLFGKCNVKLWVALLVGNAIPIIGALAYYIPVIINLFGAGIDIDPFSFIAGICNGLFTDLTIYVPVLNGSAFEVLTAFAMLIGSFIVGYAISGIKTSKK